MLNSLEHRGYVRRDEATSTYRLSLKLYELAHQHPPVRVLLNAALLPMERLAEAVGESCHLSMLRRGKLVVLQQALSPSIRTPTESHQILQALQTCAAKITEELGFQHESASDLL